MTDWKIPTTPHRKARVEEAQGLPCQLAAFPCNRADRGAACKKERRRGPISLSADCGRSERNGSSRRSLAGEQAADRGAMPRLGGSGDFRVAAHARLQIRPPIPCRPEQALRLLR